MMAAAGFDVMSVANNHTMHGGYRAFLRTIALLGESGIAHVGGGDTIASAREPAIVARGDHRIGFLACTSGFLPGAHAGRRTPGIVPLRRHTYAENNSWHDWGVEPDIRTLVNGDDLAAMVESITQLKAQVDVVVLSCHWGILEHVSAIADYQRVAARAFIDAGADLIVSQGPLPIKGFETYRGKAILYCMGQVRDDLALVAQRDAVGHLGALARRDEPGAGGIDQHRPWRNIGRATAAGLSGQQRLAAAIAAG